MDDWVVDQSSFLTAHITRVSKLQDIIPGIDSVDTLERYKREIEHAEQERNILDLMINDLQKRSNYETVAKVYYFNSILTV